MRKKQNEATVACLVQILNNFMSKKTLLYITQERVEISKKFQRIWIQPARQADIQQFF
jgi:hypothetical protein